MANFNANAKSNANANDREFKNFAELVRTVFKGAQYAFRTVTTRHEDPNDRNSRRVPCDPYRVLLFKKSGKELGIDGKPAKDRDDVAFFKLGQETSSAVDYSEFDWAWVVDHKDTLQYIKTVSQNGLEGYSLCLSTEESGDAAI